MEASSAIVAARLPRTWRRVVVGIALGVVALAVVGMHQLSLGHLFVTGAGSVDDPHAHSTSSYSALAASADSHSTAMTSAASMPMSAHAEVGAVAAGMGSSVEDGCAGCGDHVMGPGTCLLALTLLVLFWFLRLPRPRSLPPLRRRSGSSVVLPCRRPRIRALSFLELSILRT